MSETDASTSSANSSAIAGQYATQTESFNGSDTNSVVTEDSFDALLRRNAELSEANAHLTEAVAARDAFLAVAAHELRNPMTPIIGRVQLLRRMIGKPDFQMEKVDQRLDQIEGLITQYVKRATTLLDVSRMTTGKLNLSLAPVNASALAREVTESFRPIAEHAGAVLGLDLPDDDLAIVGDRLALEQILDNLVSNAIKYGAGKPIVVSANVEAEKGIACICVRDEGPGISPADQTRIFQRFERAVRPGERAGGFGVGLWLVRQLCDAMGGTIEVTSAPEMGSTFCVTLPLSPTQDRE